MDAHILLVTDGAYKGKTSKKAGSGIIIHNYENKAQHEFMFHLGSYGINRINHVVKNADIPVGKYRIEFVEQDGYLMKYKIDDYIDIEIYTSDVKYPPTNNRAEYLAYILGNILCTVLYPNTPIALVSDSMLLINSIKVWMTNWVKKGLIPTKENSDLLFEIHRLHDPINCYHINSHLSIKDYQKLSEMDKYFSKLNDQADKLANDAIL